jgi:hypothetical protein
LQLSFRFPTTGAFPSPRPTGSRPQWRIKPFTQSYSNIAGTLQAQLYKISRQTNIIADTLAKQAQSSTSSTHRLSIVIDLNVELYAPFFRLYSM